MNLPNGVGHVHVDRVAVLDQIRRWAERAEPAHVLAVVCGIAMIGKSAVLHEAVHRHHTTNPVAYIDLARAHEPMDVLETLVGRLLARIALNRYAKAKKSILPMAPHFSAGDVSVTGGGSLTLINDGAAYRRYLADGLAIQLIEDLRTARGPRIVVMLDHYDAPSGLELEWLAVHLLLPMVVHTNTLVLIASPNPPWGEESPLIWLGLPIGSVHEFQLDAFSVDDVLEWMAALGLKPNRDIADFAARTLRGMPAEIGAALAAYIANGGTGAA